MSKRARYAHTYKRSSDTLRSYVRTSIPLANHIYVTVPIEAYVTGYVDYDTINFRRVHYLFCGGRGNAPLYILHTHGDKVTIGCNQGSRRISSSFMSRQGTSRYTTAHSVRMEL